MKDAPSDLEMAFIREFSVLGNQIGKSAHKADRRERVRSAIYTSGQMAWKFQDTQMTYAEAFRQCYGERLDRRAAQREVPPAQDLDEGIGTDDDESQDT